MKIIYERNLNALKEIVENNSKYQKVMIIYDDSVETNYLHDIYEAIKTLCIYDCKYYKNVNGEIYNGYKLVVYLLTIDNFLSLNFDRDEFVNVYMPNDDKILPYFLSEKNIANCNDDYLILANQNIESTILSSVELNLIYGYIYNLIYSNMNKPYEHIINGDITQSKLIEVLNNMSGLFFLDIEILKKQNIEYRLLPVVDLMIIDAFEVFLDAIESNNLQMRDLYKIIKDDEVMIDKFYALLENCAIKEILRVNYSRIKSKCDYFKKEVFNKIYLDVGFNNSEILDVKNKISNYFKCDDGILPYLYLYDIV